MISKIFSKIAGMIIIPAFVIFPQIVLAQEQLSYQKPPKAIEDIINNSINRNLLISNSGNYVIFLEEPSFSNIEDINKPLLKLAGIRFETKTANNNNTKYYTKATLKNTATNEEFILNGLPQNNGISNISFSPDESMIAFCLKTNNGIELWTASTQSFVGTRATHFKINNTFGTVYQWASDNSSIIAKFINENNRFPQTNNSVPKGPVIMENLGKRSPTRTYQDLLSNASDEQLFDYYFISQLKTVYLSNGETVNFGNPAIYNHFDFSPDGKLVMTTTVEKPYSYNVPIYKFPKSVDVYDKFGKYLKNLNKSSLEDNLPNGFDAVTTDKREFQWRNDLPQTYMWVEAQDGGDPNIRVAIRDIVYIQDFDSNKKVKLAECYLRFKSIDWGDDQIAIITERWWKTRTERRVFIKPNNHSYRVNLWDRYYEDSYSDPGYFVTTKNEFNKKVLLLDFNGLKRLADVNNINIFTISEGASVKGNQPFLQKFNVKTKIVDTLFKSKAPYYEIPVFYNLENKIIFSRESNTEPTNYFFSNSKSKKENQLSFFDHPYPNLKGIESKLLQYKRNDGLALNAKLYLPKGYTVSQGKLPVLMWAYPKEYKTAQSAAQVKGSPYQFSKISWSSPIFWVTQGYAVMDNVDMPIVGESNEQPNDTFIEQLKENAVAAINQIVNMDIGDRDKIAIGGHSYGAFMTANLLAHTNLFAAGIARSGAYNRTLTPFGFQAEERTIWDAPNVYIRMSPFNYADRIKTPILLIHGSADENSGTFPLQSERFYTALKGNGATTRLVLLPAEAHSYKAKESVLHMLWEMDNWLKNYVKNK